MSGSMLYQIPLVDLGHLLVFCYQTEHEYKSGAPYKEVFWRKKDFPLIHGPFNSVHEATDHFTKSVLMERNKQKYGGDNIILVDFKNKRRMK